MADSAIGAITSISNYIKELLCFAEGPGCISSGARVYVTTLETEKPSELNDDRRLNSFDCAAVLAESS